jgi:RNA polymerase sigma-70 factor, ECF subfamily
MSMTNQANRRPPQSPQDEIVAVSDATLAARTRHGDPAAFELIMRRYNQRLYRMTRSILRNNAEAEDAVQETYLRAFEKLADFAGPDGFAAWIGRIAINEALGRLRKRGRVIAMDAYPGAGSAGDRPIERIGTDMPDPERLAANSQLRQALEHAIDTLPGDFRAVFMLRAVEGMSVIETADCLGIKPETVKTRFHRARRLLQDDLGAKFEALMPTAFSFDGARCDRITASVLARLPAA